MRRCCTARPAAGRAAARTAAPGACSTRATARCAATTAGWPSACRGPAPSAATWTSSRSAAAPSGWRSSWRWRCPRRASRASTPTARGPRARCRRSWPPCMPARWTCSWARRWSPRDTTSARITLVAAVNPDAALFASDFRAPERLFALLMQAAGRAGRDAGIAARSEMWIQTWHPRHALYAALRPARLRASSRAGSSSERASAGLPPFSHLALLRAEAREASSRGSFPARSRRGGARRCRRRGGAMVYPPVPPPVSRVADVERLQMLVESRSRVALQRLLAAWLPQLHALRAAHKARAALGRRRRPDGDLTRARRPTSPGPCARATAPGIRSGIRRSARHSARPAPPPSRPSSRA